MNVAVRAHYMPVFSRLGPYDPGLVDDAAWTHSARRPRLLVEYWAHEASLLPVADWPLLLSGAETRGMVAALRGACGPGAAARRRPARGRQGAGPVGAGALEAALGAGAARPTGASWWARSDVKRICEYLFGTGALTTGARVHFQRLYDLPERVLPPEVLAAHPADPEVSARALVLRAAGALGVATEPDLRDYYRLGPAHSQQAVAELLEEGALQRVAVRGWRHPAYRLPGTRTLRRITARARLSPFDPLIWERARTERIFGFRYRIEIYVPEPQRENGYYVFPFLLDDALVARVDLKADRVAGVLRVPGAFGEPPRPSAVAADRPRVVAELAGRPARAGGLAGARRGGGRRAGRPRRPARRAAPVIRSGGCRGPGDQHVPARGAPAQPQHRLAARGGLAHVQLAAGAAGPGRQVQLGQHPGVDADRQAARPRGQVHPPGPGVGDGDRAGARAHADVRADLTDPDVAAAGLDVGRPTSRADADRARAGPDAGPPADGAQHDVARPGGDLGVAVHVGGGRRARPGPDGRPPRPAADADVTGAGPGRHARARRCPHHHHQRHHP